jgi:tRNA modification GTPase
MTACQAVRRRIPSSRMLTNEDTIVAISSAAGIAPRAIVRLSGPKAGELADRVFQSADGRLSDLDGFRRAEGRAAFAVALSGSVELPAQAYVFRRPRSYTRQDVVEIHLPGCPAAARGLLEALLSAGARQAQPGEFTARAFLSGRIDLSQAEAVADVIQAADESQLRASLAALGGEVRRLTAQAAETAAEALATVEASIDLAEEHIELASPGDLAEKLDSLGVGLRSIAETSRNLPDAADQPTVVLAGRANVGKSSLLNALTGGDRAITSALAGTTRDVLSAPLPLGEGLTVRLLDAAGFRPVADELAMAADNAARRAVARADVVCFVVDATRGDEQVREDDDLLSALRRSNPAAPLLVLCSKCDVARPRTGGETVIATSARRGEGLDAVKQRLRDLLHLEAQRGGEALGLHDRQRRCLLAAAEAARRAASLLAGATEIADVAELAAVELREMVGQLGEISGQIVTEDILGRIFARFCVGK